MAWQARRAARHRIGQGLTAPYIAIYRDAARYHASHQDRTVKCSRTTPTTTPTTTGDVIAGTPGTGRTAGRAASAKPSVAAGAAAAWSAGARSGRSSSRYSRRSPCTATRSSPSSRPRAAAAGGPSAGSVYPTLQQLSDEGLVTSEEIDGRRVYALTDEGKAAAAAGPRSPWAELAADAATTSATSAPGRRSGDAGAARRHARGRRRGPGDPDRHARQALRPARLRTPAGATRRDDASGDEA